MSKKVNFRLTTGMLIVASMLCITACGGKTDTENIQNTASSGIEYAQNATEMAEKNLGGITIDDLKEQISLLMSLRFTGDYSILDKVTCLDSNSKAEILKVIKETDSEYLDITDVFDSNYNEIKAQIESLGGTIHEDGSITYADTNVPDILEDDEDVNTGEESISEEENATDMTEQALPNEPGTVAETIGALETVEESQEFIEEAYESAEEEEYYGGGEPVGENSDGYLVDADGNILIPGGTSGVNPLTEDLMDLDGNFYWHALSEREAEKADNDKKMKYFEAWKAWGDALRGSSNKAQDYLNKQQEALETAPDIEDGLGDSENPMGHMFDRPSNISELGETSECIKFTEDGKKYIEWKDVINGYNPQYGMFTYYILGYEQKVDFTKTYIPVNAMAGDERYDFILVDWRVLDTGDAIFNFESKTTQDGLGFTVEVRGKLKDGIFTPEDTKRFTEFYF